MKIYKIKHTQRFEYALSYILIFSKVNLSEEGIVLIEKAGYNKRYRLIINIKRVS
ncbi:hypothetical protein [Halonatronum saccharophilum]|uniref:hypothetical protein n=1 Tax=Halonatronum saccharophilum TaxID=150060 RepID=UPI0004ADD1D7|nr:hypothetical protein [Halonatronum saccharophilum]